MRECMAFQPRQQCQDDPGADRGRDRDDKSEFNAVHRATFAMTQADSRLCTESHEAAIKINRLLTDRAG